MKRHSQNMLSGPLLPSIVRYTIPVILTGVLQLLFNAADLVIVGRFCGSISVAAVGATSSVTNLIVNLFVGMSVGAGVTVAHAIGGRNQEAVHRTVHTALPAALISGVFLTAVGIFASEPLLRMMGTPDTVLPLSAIYMKIYFAGITFTMVYNFSASILRAAGDTRSPLIFLSLAGVINVCLNVVFVTRLHMNVAGVALATVISQAISALLVVIVLMRRTDACRLCLRKMRIYPIQLMKILRIGLPAGIQSSLFSISNVMIQSSVNSFGDVFMSGNAAAMNIENFVYIVLNAFSQTTVNFVGQNVGAGQYHRVRKTISICLVSVAATGVAIGGLIYGFSPQLLSIYITDSPEAIAYGVLRMGIICLPYFLCGMMEVSTGALRGMGASLLPMAISVIGVCGIRITWLLTIFRIPAFHTPECLYLSYPITWGVTFAVQLAAFIKLYRRHTLQEHTGS